MICLIEISTNRATMIMSENMDMATKTPTPTNWANLLLGKAVTVLRLNLAMVSSTMKMKWEVDSSFHQDLWKDE